MAVQRLLTQNVIHQQLHRPRVEHLCSRARQRGKENSHHQELVRHQILDQLLKHSSPLLSEHFSHPLQERRDLSDYAARSISATSTPSNTTVVCLLSSRSEVSPVDIPGCACSRPRRILATEPSVTGFPSSWTSTVCFAFRKSEPLLITGSQEAKEQATDGARARV